MTNKVKDIFVTAAICIEGNITNLSTSIKAISHNLSTNYAHHEILVVSDSRLTKENEDELNNLLKEVYFVRSLKVFGKKSKDTLEAIAFENAIGDIVVAGSIEEISDNIMNDFVLTCCNGNDVVMSNSKIDDSNDVRFILHRFYRFFTQIIDSFNLIPLNFTGMCYASRRAINAASKLPRFEMFPFLHLASSMQNVKELDINHKCSRKNIIESMKYALDLFSYNTTAHISILCFSAFLTLCISSFISSNIYHIVVFSSINLFAILFFMSNSFKRLINNKIDVEQYSVEYDKHSSVMLDLTELNIRSDSTSDMVNKVQTGRDR